jgi:Na+-transporting NADH:ubiquinone oxidoreductase subunit NqrD
MLVPTAVRVIVIMIVVMSRVMVVNQFLRRRRQRYRIHQVLEIAILSTFRAARYNFTEHLPVHTCRGDLIQQCAPALEQTRRRL